MNQRYKIHLVSKEYPDENSFHDDINERICVINFLEVGLPLRGIYMYEDKIPHLFLTSDVVNISEKEDGNIFVETLNTFYKFEKILDKE